MDNGGGSLESQTLYEWWCKYESRSISRALSFFTGIPRQKTYRAAQRTDVYTVWLFLGGTQELRL